MTTAAVPISRRAAIPRIKLVSWLGLESVAWAVAIGHLVKWTVDALYYLIVQCTWWLPTPPGGTPFKILYLKNSWDDAPVHISNLLGLHWFGGSQVAPEFWVTDRHYARDVLIGLVAGVIITFLFVKPHHPEDADVSAWAYVWSVPKAVIWAIPGIAIVAVIAWKLMWLTHHGLAIPGSSVLANEVNGYVAAGTWIAVAMGIAGSQVFARFANRKAADAAQWFYAERSAAILRSDQGLARFRTHVFGPPAYRVRVHWLLDHPDIACVEHSVWSVRLLTFVLGASVLLAGFGAWLTLAGPAAGAH
jgi:hypothetical protein